MRSRFSVGRALLGDQWLGLFGRLPQSPAPTINGAAYLPFSSTAAARFALHRAEGRGPVLWGQAACDHRQQRERGYSVPKAEPYAFDALGPIRPWISTRKHSARGDRRNNDAILRYALNSGVYKAGFAHDASRLRRGGPVGVFRDVSQASRIGSTDGRRFVLAETLTDERLCASSSLLGAFSIPPIHGLFKCNIRRLADYPRLSAYLARVRSLPGVEATVSIDHIKAGYYSIKALNPSGIVPAGPGEGWTARDALAPDVLCRPSRRCRADSGHDPDCGASSSPSPRRSRSPRIARTLTAWLGRVAADPRSPLSDRSHRPLRSDGRFHSAAPPFTPATLPLGALADAGRGSAACSTVSARGRRATIRMCAIRIARISIHDTCPPYPNEREGIPVWRACFRTEPRRISPTAPMSATRRPRATRAGAEDRAA